MELRLLQSLTTRRRPQQVPRPCGASHEVWPPSAPTTDRIHDKYPGLASPGYGPPPGFLTLLTDYAPVDLPALFHAGDTHGVFPFRAFPSRAAVAPLDARSPHAVSSALGSRVRSRRPMQPARRRRAKDAPGIDGRVMRSPTPGPGTAWESVSRSSGLASPQARCSLGVQASSGPCEIRTWDDCFQSPSSHGLLRHGLPEPPKRLEMNATPALRSITRSGRGRAGSHQRINPLEVLNLVSRLDSAKREATLAYGFASGPEPRHRAPQTLFGLPRAPTGAHREASVGCGNVAVTAPKRQPGL